VRLKTQVLLLRIVVWALAIAPAAWLVRRAVQGDLGANPIEELLHRTGDWALILLLLALAVTPIRIVTGWTPIQKVRRLVGLWAFTYVSTHFLIYLLIDQGLIFELSAVEFIREDIAERPFITVGFAAWLLLIPLAVTSTRGWIRRLGSKWRTLHRLVYVASALGLIHFFWKVKADTRLPLVAIGVWTVLMAVRVRKWTRGRRQNGPSNPSSAARNPSETAMAAPDA